MSRTPAKAVSTAKSPPRYTLLDVETFNVVGTYRSRRAALRDVAETAKRYGPASPEVLSLSLARDAVPADEGLVAQGQALVTLALETFPAEASAA
jgi:hypothetical protein